MASILIIEDNNLIGHAAKLWLKRDNSVVWVQKLSDARVYLSTAEFDIILLDLGLPDGNGLELLSHLKRTKHEAGIIIMTAYGDVDNRIEGLDLGADDYLVKPIDFKELDARIRAVKRRKDGLTSTIVEHGALQLDTQGMNVTVDNKPVHLSRMEVSILAILLLGKNRYHSKSMIEQRLYGINESIKGNTIEVHVSSLRKKLGKNLIKTTRGLGYVIERMPN